MLDGRLQRKADPSRFVDIADVMRRNDLTEITETFTSRPSPERQNYASLAHGAQFIEVKVDPDLGTVRVTRAIEVSACRKIMNPKASHSQEIGGIVWGIGMARDGDRPSVRSHYESEPAALSRAGECGRPSDRNGVRRGRRPGYQSARREGDGRAGDGGRSGGDRECRVPRHRAPRS